ncbi:MAG: serine hydrolase domain-containing protein [Dermatophilus congolensis]|nr:serine hydrolase domain-containing protein [Dermatophilus congolensis]
MRRLTGIFAALAVALFLAVSSAASTRAADAVQPSPAEAVRKAIDAPGVAVVVRTGDVRQESYSGIDGDGAPVGPDTRFLIGSVSKSFTAAAVLALDTRGALALDEPVSRELSWFPHGDVTVRDLLRHTSGYDAAAGLRHADLFDNTPGALDQAARAAAGEPRAATPGMFSYSDVNYLVLGALVEQVTGMSFDRAVHDLVLDPADLRATNLAADDTEPAPGYRRWWTMTRPFDPGFDTSGVPYGYVMSTAPDLMSWADAQQEGAHLPAAQRHAMTSEQVSTGTDRAGLPTWYGFGWRGGSLDGHGYVEHTGANPGYFAHVLWLPDDDIAVTVLANTYSQAGDEVLAEQARNLARQAVGVEPVNPRRDALLSSAPWIAAGVLAIGLVLLCLTLVRRARPAPASRLRAWVGALLAAATAVGCWVLPSVFGFDSRLLRLWVPDLGWALLLAVVVYAALAAALLLGASRSGAGEDREPVGAGGRP